MEDEHVEMLQRDAYVTSKYGERAHRMCGSKKRYATKSVALGRASKSTQRGATQLRAYLCPYCGGWHLTKSTKVGDVPAPDHD